MVTAIVIFRLLINNNRNGTEELNSATLGAGVWQAKTRIRDAQRALVDGTVNVYNLISCVPYAVNLDPTNEVNYEQMVVEG
jgi:hypothetical protein